MSILLFNAGSSSLKCTLMRAADQAVIAQGAADWAGASAKYEYTGPDNKKRTETVTWRGYAEAVSRPLHAGRTVVVVETDVTDADGRPVAKILQTQAVLRSG